MVDTLEEDGWGRIADLFLIARLALCFGAAQACARSPECKGPAALCRRHCRRPSWGMLDIVLTGKTIHNFSRQKARSGASREGIIYNTTGPASARGSGFVDTLLQALPAHSCEVVSSEVTREGLGKVQIRLEQSNDNKDNLAIPRSMRSARCDSKASS